VETDTAVREDESDCVVSQLGYGSGNSQSSVAADSSMTVGTSKTLQPYHTRPTDFVHRTRDAGDDMWVFVRKQYLTKKC